MIRRRCRKTDKGVDGTMNGLSLDDAGQKKRFLEVLPLLIANLRDELRRIEALHACLLREKEILCGGSPQALAQSNSDKEQALLDLEATRSLRSPLLMELSDLSGIFVGSDVRPNAGLPGAANARRELTTSGRRSGNWRKPSGCSTTATADSLKTHART
jgi:hypothetical protein